MLTGSIAALITPMDKKGNICQASLKKLIDYHVYSGTSAIVLAGSTGESATLTYNEHYDVVMLALELADDRIPIIAGTGKNATAKAITLTRSFNGSGVVACLAVTPYYNCPTQEGLFQHFKAISENTDLPQILYNIPSRSACDLLPKTIGRLSRIKNIAGIKEATGNLTRVHQIKELVSDDFILLSGDDASALDFIQLGGHGVVSVTANLAAHDMAMLCQLALKGHFHDARVINKRLMSLHSKLFVEPNPIPIKWACKELGLIESDTVRLPLTPLSERARGVVANAMKQAGLL